MTIAKRLTDAVFSVAQAEARASVWKEIVESDLATKRDFMEVEAGLKRDIKELDTSLRGEIVQSVLRTRAQISELQATTLRVAMAMTAFTITAIGLMIHFLGR
ncbi:MAG TPA: hypothetical protein PK264_00220 [Hyphomicrobiaceae bacterium]|nr:hypothetical protein [Hyphomicrobiaceae bacterium]